MGFFILFSCYVKMDKHITYKDYQAVIKRTYRGFPKHLNIIAGDTETKPALLVGLMSNDSVMIKEVDSIKERYKVFLFFLEKLSKKNYLNVCCFHNLKFDLQVLFLYFKEKFQNDSFELYLNDKYQEISYEEMKELKHNKEFFIKISAFCCKTWFVHINIKNKKVIIIDSFSFFRKSLKKLGEELNLKNKKYNVDFDRVSIESLKKYLKNDLKTQYNLTEFILDFHKLYDVYISVSIAQLSQRIFRHHFLKSAKIRLPDHEAVIGCIKSFHGGKNGIYCKKITKIRNALMVDVNSMYPYAMTKIPNFSNCSYDFVKEFNNKYDGVYQIWGKVKKCKYPIIYSHDFKPLSGIIKGIWITSYELKEAIKRKEIKIERCIGIVIKEVKNSYNPIKEYVLHFYDKKTNIKKNNPLYKFYKLCLNSLYGKFIQHMVYNEAEYEVINGEIIANEKRYKAGGLFNPFIATLITGFSRAFMHNLEHKYKSIHTATDSIVTTLKNIPVSNKLGGLSKEAEGDILIFRNKCYIMFSDIIKYAKHGFHSDIETLLKMYLTNNYVYEYSRFTNIREGMKRVEKKVELCEWNEFKNVKFNVV